MSIVRGFGRVVTMLAVVGTSRAAAQGSIADQVTCTNRDDQRPLRMAFQLRISGCQAFAECQFTMHQVGGSDADIPARLKDADSIRTTLSYEVHLTSSTVLETQPGSCEDRSIEILAINPARLASKRVLVMFDGTSVDGKNFPANQDSTLTLHDVPMFGDEGTRVTVMVSAVRAREVRAAIEAAKARCSRGG